MNEQKPSPLTEAQFPIIHSIFRTIQGEGPNTGTPACFIRLAYCNLQCKLCDTEYTKGALPMNPIDVRISMERLGWQKSELVVITGGEPLRQPIALANLLNHVKAEQVDIETNGTYSPSKMISELDPFIEAHINIICAPKLGIIHKDILDCANAFKILINAKHIDPETGWPSRTLGGQARGPESKLCYRPGIISALRTLAVDKKVPVYVHPEDTEQGDFETMEFKENQRAAVEFVHRNPGFRLGCQLHKYYDLD